MNDRKAINPDVRQALEGALIDLTKLAFTKSGYVLAVLSHWDDPMQEEYDRKVGNHSPLVKVYLKASRGPLSFVTTREAVAPYLPDRWIEEFRNAPPVFIDQMYVPDTTGWENGVGDAIR